MQNRYLKKAVEFFERGKVEYEEGLKENDTIKVREGCEKVFHAIVELSDGIISEHGYPIPEDHATRAELLQQFGMHKLYYWIKGSLHDSCYYSGSIKKKLIEEAIESVNDEIKKRT
ncbi:MAG: hypothetical protein ACE5KT_07605 [Methanosarcinales archaeon]|nr:hypothetical protein [Methanosarcinales archaeon]